MESKGGKCGGMRKEGGGDTWRVVGGCGGEKCVGEPKSGGIPPLRVRMSSCDVEK